MKKFSLSFFFTQIFLYAIIPLVVIIFINVFTTNFDTSKEGIYHRFIAEFQDYKVAVNMIKEFKINDKVKSSNYKDVEAKLKYINGEKMNLRELHVIHNSNSDNTKFITREKISSSAIETIFSSNWIRYIYVNEKNYLFYGDEKKTIKDGEYWGIYYSLNGEPQIVFLKTLGELNQEGKGWSCTDERTERYYYTEKIKEDFYFYIEGDKRIINKDSQ